MRDRFRKVKDKFSSKKRKDSVTDVTRTNSDDSEISAQPSFLGLPAEIRNEIYEYLATSTTLTLATASPKKRPLPAGLLLACKQTREEYHAILMSQALLIVVVANYNFSIIVRTFEKMATHDLELIQMNPQIWIYLQLGHVPSRDDRRALRAWCDYRSDTVSGSYFGSGRKVPQDLAFQYNVSFLSHMRPPRPISRYTNGYQMRLDLLRTHLRMAARLQAPTEEVPSLELKKLRDDLDSCVKVLEELSTESPAIDG